AVSSCSSSCRGRDSMGEQENGRLEWLKDELRAMESRITGRIDRLEAVTTDRLNDHSKRLKTLEEAENREVGAQTYKRWLFATALALVGAIGTIVGIVSSVRGGTP